MNAMKCITRRLSRSVLISVGLTVLLLSPISVLAQVGNGKGPSMKPDKGLKRVVLSSDGFQVEINAGGQVPFYHFNTSAGKFFFKFQKIIQFTDNNDNGVYDQGEEIKAQGGILSLPSVNWDLTILTDTNESKEFSFNSTQIRQPGYDNAKIVLVNHFDGTNPEVKFDVFISDWPFVAGATGLALEFELIWDEDAGLVKESTDTAVVVKDSNGVVHAKFDIVSNIVVDGNEVTDGAQLVDTAADNQSKLNIYINYPTFGSSLEHDPTISSSYTAIKGETAGPSAIFRQIFGDFDARNAIGGFAVLTALGSLAVLSLVWINKKKK